MPFKLIIFIDSLSQHKIYKQINVDISYQDTDILQTLAHKQTIQNSSQYNLILKVIEYKLSNNINP